MKVELIVTLCAPGEEREVGKRTTYRSKTYRAKGRNKFKNLSVDGRIVLTGVLGKDIRTRLALFSLRIGFKAELL
jgi:hypothetical protein